MPGCDSITDSAAKMTHQWELLANVFSHPRAIFWHFFGIFMEKMGRNGPQRGPGVSFGGALGEKALINAILSNFWAIQVNPFTHRAVNSVSQGLAAAVAMRLSVMR